MLTSIRFRIGKDVICCAKFIYLNPFFLYRNLSRRLGERNMENPSATSAPIASDDAILVPDSGSQIGKATRGGSSVGNDAEFGFQRAEFGTEELAGTVHVHERHLFLCYKQPNVWPSNVEAAEFDRLPRLLAAALTARKADIKKKTRLTLSEGEDGTEFSNGDVLIFPDMIRYRRLTHFDVEAFVEEVLVKENEWFSGVVEPLTGSYIFVCSHGSRDKRCGVCGPELIKQFREEVTKRGLQVSVNACSHVGGHKYAGNIIIFGKGIGGKVAGHWYGYVSPDDVPELLEQHIIQGDIVTRLWRGQMGFTAEQQKKMYELMLEAKEKPVAAENGCGPAGGGCCQGPGFTCGQSPPLAAATAADGKISSDGEAAKQGVTTKAPRKVCSMPTWIERWEREKTYAALAVAAAAVAVVVAYSCFKHST